MWKETGIPIAPQYINDTTCPDDNGDKCLTIKMHDCGSFLPLEVVNCDEALCYPACATCMCNKPVEGNENLLIGYEDFHN